jgi:hypothetical protein
VEGSLSQFTLRLALIVAAASSVVVLTGLFSDAVRYVCVGVVLAAAAVTVSERRRPGGGWWMLLGTGAILSVVGAGLAELNDTLGGLCAVAGGALVVIAATIGFPADD